ncbi:phosphate starvation protein PhoH [Kiloniella litopenaei]|uniref:PhoH-like protein n=1 Tax=Kiloniella litopenaei TaxID=1549748 RepID=A0A0M2RB21_9PROT|nr:phosphate starvation protein PhoH [Kiloniella litopenaei]
MTARARNGQAARGARQNKLIEFDDNSLLPMLYGEHDQHLVRLEQHLDVDLASRGNQVSISGSKDSVATAKVVLKALYERLQKGLDVGDSEVDAVVRMAQITPDVDETEKAVKSTHGDELAIVTRKRRLNPRSPGQAAYIKAMQRHELVFGVGPAGTGKTYMAVAYGVSLLLNGDVERIILSRPAVEAGERLGFLPGDMKDKVDPYLRPLYDALHDMLPSDQVMGRLENGEIEIAPLAFMRGRTLSNAFVILDEAQNTTPVQMKMFLTRLGERSRMVVTGDMSQVDLPKGQLSGLRDASQTLAKLEEVGFVQFAHADIVRHELVTKIVRAYDNRQNKGEAEERDFFDG